MMERVQLLIDQLLSIATQIYDLEKSLLERLDYGDQEAHLFFKKATTVASGEYQKIGNELNTLGGIELMQFCHSKIPQKLGCRSVISSAWNGIGNWQH